MFLWDWIKSIGGKRSEEAAEREELGGEDPGESEVEQWSRAGAGTGSIGPSDAADVAEADLREFEPPRDPSR
jgi:hypothetical protein